MNKQSVTLPGDQGEWGSYISKYQPDSTKVLDNMFTANSKNFVTDQTGMIDKRQGGVTWNRTSFGNVAKDTYEAIFESGARHFLRVGGGTLSASTGTGLFDVITSGYSAIGNFEWVTYQNRIYGDNGINAPQVYDIATSYGGVSYSFTTGKTKVMGAQAPVSAPTAGTPTSGGAVPIGAHRYQITFQYYGSEESNGSPMSATQTTTSGVQTIPLTAIPIGGYGVTARNIYRDFNGDGNFLLVDTIPNNTATTYTDILSQGSTPTPIPLFNDVPPTFSKIALWLDSIFIAPSGETSVVRYSNTGAPDAFDPSNFITCQSDDVVTALYVYNGKLYVFGLHSVGTIEGTTPDTFYYHNLSNKIGCVDNRSIQIRSIVSVPTLWWLSDKGLYYSNGYTVEYGSDYIQDLVSLNIAQVNYTTNKNTQTSFTDFSGDTYTPSIDISSQPGSVTTINPVQEYNTTADWVGGSTVTNIKTGDANFAEVPTQFNPNLSTGVLSGNAQISGTNLTLSASADFLGESEATVGTTPVGSFANTTFHSSSAATEIAFRIIPPRSGNLTSVTIPFYVICAPGTQTCNFNVYNDAIGTPGASIFSTSFSVTGPTFPNSAPFTYSASVSVPLTGGTAYWLAVGATDQSGRVSIGRVVYSSLSANWTGSELSYARLNVTPFDVGPWLLLSDSSSNNNYSMAGSYTFAVTATSESGTWTSPILDLGNNSPVAAGISQTGTYPVNTSGLITVAASVNSDMSSSVSQSASNLNGLTSISLSGYRYWRVTSALATTNNVTVPIVGTPVLTFATQGTWISQPIDGTTDNTGWTGLSYTGDVPAGTSIVLTIATSTDNSTYSSFGPISGAATTQWAKVRFVLSTDSGNTVSPSVSSITLTWTVTGTITSSIIDTGTIPAGFGIFQWSETNLGVGTVVFSIRTAASSGAIPAASWVPVTNGTFPALSALEFVQWKAVLTSTANATPVITDVTVNWYLGSGSTSVRCSSIFYNKTYYLSVATSGATANNTIIQLDQFGKWRIQQDTSVGTFLLYFNSLYFTDGGNDNIYNGFIANTDNGTAIMMDVRTKAWNAPSDLFLKVPRGLKVTGLNTGTTLHAYYSYDRGKTWIEMLNESGIVGYTTKTDYSEFVTLFVVDADTLVSGRTLMYRITSPDTFPCSIINYMPSFYTRRGRYLSNG